MARASQAPDSLFTGSTVSVAKRLLGCLLIHDSKEGTTAGRIVETEAYLRDDPASHTFRGMTPRNEIMFHHAGYSYVYFVYGMYFCFNVSTNRKGIGEGVLIRALEPVEGIELMQKRRKVERVRDLCNGPGKLTIAMGITAAHNATSLQNGPLRIEPRQKTARRGEIITTRRVGLSVAKDLDLRFLLKDNPHVSR